MSCLFTLEEIESALPIVRTAVPPTPQYAWPRLAARTGAEVFVKHENHTPIGAFKVRGGMVYMDRLMRQQPQVKGVVSATRGNHGQSLAFAARGAGIEDRMMQQLRSNIRLVEKVGPRRKEVSAPGKGRA